MVIKRLHGDERELTLMALTRSGNVITPAKLIGPILESLKSLGPYVSLTDREGVFLPHGRLYRESGGLLELAGADTWSPLEAVRQGALLRHAVAGALDAVADDLNLHDFVASQHNTAYSVDNPQHATAGHFNITRYRPVDSYFPALATLGAALPCISGGGGFDMETLQFTLSIRSLRCIQLTSNKTQSERGIIDLKPMPASHGDRQQIMNVDNLQSHVQTRCVYTLLNLFYTCAENDLAALPDIALAEPVEDMHRMIRGPRLKHQFTATDGRRFTGTEILRRFVDAYASRLNAAWMPSWAEAELTHAADLIDRLHGAELTGCVGITDHATLHHLWQAALNEYGLSPSRAEQARRHLVQMAKAYNGACIFQDDAASFVKCADALNGEVGRPSTDCSNYLCAARSFMQLAYAYGDIRHQGLFAQLKDSGFAAGGVLFDRDHCAANAYSPVPASEGRSAARSTAILKLHADGEVDGSAATWDFIRAPKRGELCLTDYSTVDADTWVKPAPPKDTKTLEDIGFSAMNEYLSEREARIASTRRGARPLIMDNEEGVIGDIRHVINNYE